MMTLLRIFSREDTLAGSIHGTILLLKISQAFFNLQITITHLKCLLKLSILLTA